MSNVITVDFKGDSKEGYIIDGKNIEGIYINDLAASLTDDGSVVTGSKDGKFITGENLSLKRMNRFYLMWLAIFDESVIVKEDVKE